MNQQGRQEQEGEASPRHRSRFSANVCFTKCLELINQRHTIFSSCSTNELSVNTYNDDKNCQTTTGRLEDWRKTVEQAGQNRSSSRYSESRKKFDVGRQQKAKEERLDKTKSDRKRQSHGIIWSWRLVLLETSQIKAATNPTNFTSLKGLDPIQSGA